MGIQALATKAAFNAQTKTRGMKAEYFINENDSFCLVAIPAETERDNLGEDGLVMSERSQDWLISKDDIPGVEPARSHWVVVNGERFDLVQWENEKHFRFHDAPTNQIYRIHTLLGEGEPG